MVINKCVAVQKTEKIIFENNSILENELETNLRGERPPLV